MKVIILTVNQLVCISYLSALNTIRFPKKSVFSTARPIYLRKDKIERKALGGADFPIFNQMLNNQVSVNSMLARS